METKKPFYFEVDSLEYCVPGIVYSTKNHDMLKPLVNNRGSEKGYVQERVNHFKRMIENNTFHLGTVHVMVNLNGYSIDGNNRNRSLKDTDNYVNFIITREPKFNDPDPSVILNNVSEHNSTNSRWNPLESFRSALRSDEPCALSIDRIQNKVCEKFGIKRTTLTPSRILSLVTCFENGYNNNTYPRRSFCNNELSKRIDSLEFENILESVCQIMKICKTKGTKREWDVIIQMSKRIFNNTERPLNIIDFSLEFSYTLKRIQMYPKEKFPIMEDTSDINWFLNRI